MPKEPMNAQDSPSQKLKRASKWAGIKQGDRVKVAGIRKRAASFEFLAHVTNVTTGDAWVEVVGGVKGDRKIRSFPPERIFAPGSHEQDLSLAEAPQLPFD